MDFLILLLTNYCNQGCPGCYASGLMGDKNMAQEMDPAAIKKILKKMNPSGKYRIIRVLGGEPTLHSRFIPVMDLLLEHSDMVVVFTNGIFSEDVFAYLKAKAPRIRLIFNVGTPGFRFNRQTRDEVTGRIISLSQYTHVSASLTFLPQSHTPELLSPLSSELLKSIHTIRFGITNPSAGGLNAYGLSDFPKVGDRIEEMVTATRAANPRLTYTLDCGFTRCMFNDRQLALMEKLTPGPSYWGCFLTRQIGLADIQTDLKMIPCYSLAQRVRIDLGRTNVQKAASSLYLKAYALHEKHLPDKCRKCPFYGDGEGQCKSVCLGFMTNLSSSKFSKPQV